MFAGLRIDEALSLRWRDLDLARGTLRVRQSKTVAGERTVELLPPLRDELTDLAAPRQQSRDSLVFGTTTGGKEGASNVRRRLLARAVERANERLEDHGLEGLPERLRALVDGSLSIAELDRERSKGQGEGNKAAVRLDEEREAA